MRQIGWVGRRRTSGLSALMQYWVPDVVELESCVLRYCVVAVNFDGLSDSFGVPVLDVGE